MNKLVLVVLILLAGCAQTPPKVSKPPILGLPSTPSFKCTEITWYYVGEKLAISLEDFRQLLKCEVANKAYSKNLLQQVHYYRGVLSK